VIEIYYNVLQSGLENITIFSKISKYQKISWYFWYFWYFRYFG